MNTLTEDGKTAEWFGDLFEGLAHAYPSMKVRAEQVQVYAAALQDLTQEQIKSAMRRAILECRFFPSVAELRTFVTSSTDDAALLAWSALERAAERIGGYTSLVIDDSACADALKASAGSWTEFCALDDGPQKMVVRQAFLAAYRDARRRQLVAPTSVRLAGRCEMSGRSMLTHYGRLTLGGGVIAEREPQQAIAEHRVAQLTAGAHDDGEEGKESGVAWHGRSHDPGTRRSRR